MKLYEIFGGKDLYVAQKIQQRRYQILVHSYIYYECNTNLIDDSTFDKWGVELVKLQTEHPELAKSVVWHEAFADWSGSTGAFLPYKDEAIVRIARRLLDYANSSKVPEKPKPSVFSTVKKRLF